MPKDSQGTSCQVQKIKKRTIRPESACTRVLCHGSQRFTGARNAPVQDKKKKKKNDTFMKVAKCALNSLEKVRPNQHCSVMTLDCNETVLCRICLAILCQISSHMCHLQTPCHQWWSSPPKISLFLQISTYLSLNRKSILP